MNKHNPLIGIVIPSYNRKELLKRAVQSIMHQTYKHWFICIVDDNSTDGTESMIQRYSEESRIQYMKQDSNQGVNAARNRALDYLITEKQCDFITFLDDDDYFHPDTLLNAQQIIQKNPTKKWFVSNRVDEHGNNITRVDRYGDIPYIQYYLGITMDHDATHIIDAKTIQNIRFSKEFKQSHEWVFFMALSAKTDMFTYDFPSTICTYRDDGLSAKATTDKDIEKAKKVENLRKETLLNLGHKPETMEVLKLKYRISNTLKKKRYHKLLRYGSRFLYWKIRELLS